MRDREAQRYRPTAYSKQSGPPVLTTLIGISCAAFFLQLFFAVPTPADVPPAGYISHQQLQQGHWWTVLTHLFVHRDFLHLASNMALLWMAGRAVEEKLGPRHFAYLYFIGGWAGSMLELFGGVQGSEAQIIGASGSVFSVLGAFAVLHPQYSLTEPFRRWVTFRLRARSVIFCTIFAECVLAGLQFLPKLPSGISGGGISHLCHVGGGLFGVFFAHQFLPALKPFRPARTLGTRFVSEFSNDADAALPYVPARQTLRSHGEREHPQASKPEPLTNQEFIQSTVNPILEKLHEQGLESLTLEERSILEEAAHRLGE